MEILVGRTFITTPSTAIESYHGHLVPTFHIDNSQYKQNLGGRSRTEPGAWINELRTSPQSLVPLPWDTSTFQEFPKRRNEEGVIFSAQAGAAVLWQKSRLPFLYETASAL